MAIVLLWLGHVALLDQPARTRPRYGVFWGLIATAAVVGASRSEKARREQLTAAGPRRGPAVLRVGISRRVAACLELRDRAGHLGDERPAPPPRRPPGGGVEELAQHVAHLRARPHEAGALLGRACRPRACRCRASRSPCRSRRAPRSASGTFAFRSSRLVVLCRAVPNVVSAPAAAWTSSRSRRCRRSSRTPDGGVGRRRRRRAWPARSRPSRSCRWRRCRCPRCRRPRARAPWPSRRPASLRLSISGSDLADHGLGSSPPRCGRSRPDRGRLLVEQVGGLAERRRPGRPAARSAFSFSSCSFCTVSPDCRKPSTWSAPVGSSSASMRVLASAQIASACWRNSSALSAPESSSPPPQPAMAAAAPSTASAASRSGTNERTCVSPMPRGRAARYRRFHRPAPPVRVGLCETRTSRKRSPDARRAGRRSNRSTPSLARSWRPTSSTSPSRAGSIRRASRSSPASSRARRLRSTSTR